MDEDTVREAGREANIGPGQSIDEEREHLASSHRPPRREFEAPRTVRSDELGVVRSQLSRDMASLESAVRTDTESLKTNFRDLRETGWARHVESGRRIDALELRIRHLNDALEDLTKITLPPLKLELSSLVSRITRLEARIRVLESAHRSP